MNHEDWLERWRGGRIGFHREGVHPDLVAYQDRFLAGGPHRVLVPLCGKSDDLDWLARAGHTAIGVELSPLAIAAFHEATGRTAQAEERGPFTVWRSPGVELWCGDVFALSRDLLGPVDRVWDRAALVALPPDQRGPYTRLIASLGEGGLLLLNALRYDPTVMDGPPFTVPHHEVTAHYGAERVQLLRESDEIDQAPKWRERGHQHWWTHTSLVRL